MNYRINKREFANQQVLELLIKIAGEFRQKDLLLRL